jgi:hypothetical protein
LWEQLETVIYENLQLLDPPFLQLGPWLNTQH